MHLFFFRLGGRELDWGLLTRHFPSHWCKRWMMAIDWQSRCINYITSLLRCSYPDICLCIQSILIPLPTSCIKGKNPCPIFDRDCLWSFETVNFQTMLDEYARLPSASVSVQDIVKAMHYLSWDKPESHSSHMSLVSFGLDAIKLSTTPRLVVVSVIPTGYQTSGKSLAGMCTRDKGQRPYISGRLFTYNSLSFSLVIARLICYDGFHNPYICDACMMRDSSISAVSETTTTLPRVSSCVDG